jgi:hypothetical protein
LPSRTCWTKVEYAIVADAGARAKSSEPMFQIVKIIIAVTTHVIVDGCCGFRGPGPSLGRSMRRR